MTPWWWGLKTLVKYRTSKNYRDGEFLGPRIGDKIMIRWGEGGRGGEGAGGGEGDGLQRQWQWPAGWQWQWREERSASQRLMHVCVSVHTLLSAAYDYLRHLSPVLTAHWRLPPPPPPPTVC